MSKRLLISGLLLILVIAMSVSFFMAREKPSPWNETTTPYNSKCEGENCITAVVVAPGHRGPSLPLQYDPKIDDPVAQWGDCLESVTQCERKGQTLDICVTQSQCPTSCVDQFIVDAKGEKGEQSRKAFEAIFIDEGGLCVPPT